MRKEKAMDKVTHTIVEGHETADEAGGVDFENPPLVITFTPEQKEDLKGTILEGSRGLRLLEKDNQLVAEQLA
jgi:hypothetical protein